VDKRLTSVLLRVTTEQDLDQGPEILDQSVAQLRNGLAKVELIRERLRSSNGLDEPRRDLFERFEYLCPGV
jgi:hypothetical protein